MNALDWVRLPWLLLIPLALTSCDSVTSTQRVGEPSTNEELNASLDGAWLAAPEEVLFVKHVKDGELRIAGVEWKDDHFELKEFTGYVTIEQDVPYVNVVSLESDKDKPEYSFLRLAQTHGEDIVVYRPNAATFAKAVEEKKLPGTVKKEQYSTSVKLSADKDAMDAFIDPEKVGQQFEIDTPIVLRRVAKAE